MVFTEIKLKYENCESEFTQHSSLRQHDKAVHEGLKSFKCKEC